MFLSHWVDTSQWRQKYWKMALSIPEPGTSDLHRIVSFQLKNLLIKYWSHWEGGRWVEEQKSSTLHEAKLLSLDIGKAQYELNWHPRWDIDQTVEKTIEWYKQYKQTNVYKLSVKQIAEYCNL